MVAQSSHQGVGGFVWRGRKLHLFETGADAERERTGQGEGDFGFEVVAGAVEGRGLKRVAGRGGGGACIPLLVVILEGKSEVYAVSAEAGIFVAGDHAGVALGEL